MVPPMNISKMSKLLKRILNTPNPEKVILGNFSQN